MVRMLKGAVQDIINVVVLICSGQSGKYMQRERRLNSSVRGFIYAARNLSSFLRFQLFLSRFLPIENFLPSSCFPESCNLPSLKFEINKLDLTSLSSWPFAFFLCSGFV